MTGGYNLDQYGIETRVAIVYSGKLLRYSHEIQMNVQVIFSYTIS